MALISSKKRLYLVFHGRFPSEKAAALFAAESAVAFGNCGFEVVLLAPRRLGRAKESAFDFYGLPKNFKVVFLPTLDVFKFPGLKRFAFGVSFISFSVFAFFYLLFSAKKSDIIYSNETLPILLASFVFPKTAYEVHDFPKINFFYRAVFGRVKAVVVTNSWKRRKISELFFVPSTKILAEQNAVSINDFDNSRSVEDARRELNLPLDKKLVVYVGQLRTMGMEKGLSTAIEALKKLPEDFILILVGGSDEDVSFYRKLATDSGLDSRVTFAGFVPHKKVPLFLFSADALIAPFPKNDHYEFYMSPMKIFEYMASKRPIVTSDLESIREILSGDSAVFVPAGDSEALAREIKSLVGDRVRTGLLVSRAFQDVSSHTWENRANRIVQFLETVF